MSLDNNKVTRYLRKVSNNVERLITLKRYILLLLGVSLLFAFLEQSKIAFFYSLFAFIGIIYHDKMQKDLWIEVK